jgi:hypothetical protein
MIANELIQSPEKKMLVKLLMNGVKQSIKQAEQFVSQNISNSPSIYREDCLKFMTPLPLYPLASNYCG